MGQCGCGDYDGLVRFPGPGDTQYVLEVMPGCEECGYGPSVRLNRFTPAEALGWSALDLQELEFSEKHGGQAWIPIVDTDAMRARLHMFDAEHDDYEIDGFIEDATPETLAAACADTVESWLLRER